MSNEADSGRASPCASVWDMDGTFLRADVFAESVVRLALHKPWKLLAMPLWLLRGRAYCKGRVAELADALWTQWPVRKSAIERIASARTAGEPVLLATAAHARVAERVAAELGLFDGVVASSDELNLKGAAKIGPIRQWMSARGCHRYVYAADSAADMPVWADADAVIAVAPSRSLLRRLAACEKPVEILDRPGPWLTAVVKALRPHQWVKNLLLFMPMVIGHRFDWATLGSTCIGFVVFSLVASAVYVVNDLADLDADRGHPKKRTRPFADGTLSVKAGVALAALLLATAFLLAATTLPVGFLIVVAAYFVANLCYSAFFKQRPIFDVLMLASMYVVRLEAGGVLGNIQLSPWLLAFSLFFFTSLAFAKRYAEIRRIQEQGGLRAAGRGYMVADAETLLSFGSSSGYVAVLVLALYMNSDQMRALYGDNRLLWLICPLVMYWITRVWLLARRGRLDEDPVVFALTDRASLAAVAVCGALLAAATLLR